MAKLERFLQKVFGVNAGPNQRGVFGSLAEGAPDYSTNPETIQSLGAYENGWYSAVMGNNSPAMQDRNSLDFLNSYQLAYLMQSGVPEWNSETTYYIGSKVNVDGEVYTSLVDDNLGNLIGDASKWMNKNSFRLASMACLNFGSILTLDPFSVRGAVWAQNKLVMVGDNTTSSAAIMRGASSTAETSTTPSGTYLDVAYGNDIFVSVGFGGTNDLMSSPDGVTWTARTSVASNDWISVSYGNGLFVAVSSGSGNLTNSVMTSLDGITWTARTIPDGSPSYTPSFNKVKFVNDRFIAVPDSYSDLLEQCWVSEDGITWSRSSVGATGINLQSVAYGNGKYLISASDVSSGDPDYIMFESDDAITWTQIPEVNLPSATGAISFGNGVFISLGITIPGSGARDFSDIMISYDAVTWYASELPRNTALTTIMTSLVFAEGEFYCLGRDTSSGDSQIVKSLKVII